MSFLCAQNSYQESQTSINIDKSLKDHKLKLEGEISILILGQKKSGVTTFFKSYSNFENHSMSHNELRGCRNLIYKTIINQLKIFINVSKKQDIKLENDNIKRSNLILEIDSDNFVWTKEIGDNCFHLWNDSGVQKTFENQFSSLYGYFFNNLQRISDENYTPTPNDLKMIKLTQNGVIEIYFIFEHCNIKMIDIGTQTSSSRKWIHCFSEVQAIIYVVDISIYDLMENTNSSSLSSTSSKNKLDKSLNEIKEIIDSKYLSHTGLMVFFSKKDLFREKLKTVPFKTYDKDYIGNDDFESTTNFIKNKLFNSVSNIGKKIYFMVNEESEVDICYSTLRILKDIVLDSTLNQGNIEL
ncbi:hypothetical protein ACTFIV_000940 [Dictyostelium citrinum]